MSDLKKHSELLASICVDHQMGKCSDEVFIDMIKTINKNLNYDSEVDTLKHIKRVNELLINFSQILLERAKVHDWTKLESPEKEYFDKYTPKLKNTTYGSDEYKSYLSELQVALKHHYNHHPHHPEHFENGINGMSLFDLVEMFLDWKAASERHADGDIFRSIEQNKYRFSIEPQVCEILKNTAELLKDK